MNESEAVESGWTIANLQKLLTSMKDCIPEEEKSTSFYKGMKSLDWDKVSFPPFSPEECKQKWTDIIEKMRKMRSITELIAEAEDVILDPLLNKKMRYNECEDDLPTKPPYNGYGVFCMDCKSSGGTSKCGAMDLSLQWRKMSNSQRAEYNKRWTNLKKQYLVKLHKYLDRFSAEEQLRIIKDNNIKMHNMKLKNKAPVQEKRPCEPKMPSQVPYSYFFGEQVRLLKDEIPNLKVRHATIHGLWKGLPNKEKESYKSKVNVNLVKYSAELKNWFKTLQPAEKKSYLNKNPSKSQYIGGIMVRGSKEQLWHQTSDSEDEDMSITDEEGISYSNREEEEEEEEDIITFEID